MVSWRRVGRLAALLSVVAMAATGCRGCLTENVVYEHVFNRPDPRYCGPAPIGRPCPPLIPEFEAPPGGPYLPVPQPPPVPQPLTVAAPLQARTVQQTVTQEETISKQRPAQSAFLPEVVEK